MVEQLSAPVPGPPAGSPGPVVVRALVVDDEPALVRVVSAYLEREGFEVRTAADGFEALLLAREAEPDVVVLDVMMPGIDGLEVCRRLKTFSEAYVIMLTARAEELDTLLGLSVGADDYLTKPFSPRVLVARIRSLLRRPRAPTRSAEPAEAESGRRFGALRIDPEAREVWLDGRPVVLTRTEFDLLNALSSRPRTAFHPGAAHRPGLGPRLVRGRAPGGHPPRTRAPQARRRPHRPDVGADRARRRVPDGAGMRAPPRRGRRADGRLRAPLGFAWRLAAALALVVIAGAVTLLVVALIVAPQVFHAHLHRLLGASIEPTVQTHVDGPSRTPSSSLSGLRCRSRC